MNQQIAEQFKNLSSLQVSLCCSAVTPKGGITAARRFGSLLPKSVKSQTTPKIGRTTGSPFRKPKRQK